MAEIPDEAVELHAEWGAKMATWKSGMHLYPIDGAQQRVAKDDDRLVAIETRTGRR